MKTVNLFGKILVLLTFPALVFAPNSCPAKVFDHKLSHYVKSQELLLYDDILDLLHEIETEEFEKKASPTDLHKAACFMVSLALQGTDPEDVDSLAELESDVRFLMFDEKDDEYHFYPSYAPQYGAALLIPKGLC